MKRTKMPDSLLDGRILGKKMAEVVTPSIRKKLATVPKTGRKRSKLGGWNHDINMLCRTRMPLALTPDGDIDLGETKKMRLKGMNQAKMTAIVAAIRSGMALYSAARIAGISNMTLRNWIKRGKAGEYPYTVMYGLLQEAETECERELLESIYRAGTKTEQYDETVTETIEGPDGGVTTKTRTVTKTRLPQYMASAWILERTRPHLYRSDREIMEQEDADVDADIKAMQDISDVGIDVMGGQKQ